MKSLFSRRKFLGLGLTIPLGVAISRPALAATTHTVEIRGMSFRPRKLTIAVGDTVNFVNKDNLPHTADSRSGWKTGNINGGGSKSVTFDTAGESRYACRYHSSMTGKITVTG